MTPEQAQELGRYLRTHREAAGVSQRQVAKRAETAPAQVVRIEQGTVLNPRPEVLAAYSEAIGVPVADIFAMAHMPIARGLPGLRPYLRAKYRDLTADDAAQVEAFVDDLMRRHGGQPADGEDER